MGDDTVRETVVGRRPEAQGQSRGDSENGRMTRTAKLLLIPVTLILGVIFVAVCRLRLVDSDEGFYLLAAKSVFRGKLLYRDIFYTQMPLLPYVYGLWMKVGPATWSSGRLLAALLTTCLGVLLYCHVARLCRSWLAGCLAALLFASSCYVLAWYPLAKTARCRSAAVWRVHGPVEFSSRKALVLAGLLLGLAVDTRLYLIAVLPIFPLYIYSRRRAFPHLAASTGWFLGGLALALAPNLYWALRDPADFYFCNLGFHAIRDQAGLSELSGRKLIRCSRPAACFVPMRAAVRRSGCWSC